jgi:hypothetical protein
MLSLSLASLTPTRDPRVSLLLHGQRWPLGTGRSIFRTVRGARERCVTCAPRESQRRVTSVTNHCVILRFLAGAADVEMFVLSLCKNAPRIFSNDPWWHADPPPHESPNWRPTALGVGAGSYIFGIKLRHNKE